MFLFKLKLNDKNSLYFSINKILFICTFCVFLLNCNYDWEKQETCNKSNFFYLYETYSIYILWTITNF